MVSFRCIFPLIIVRDSPLCPFQWDMRNLLYHFCKRFSYYTPIVLLAVFLLPIVKIVAKVVAFEQYLEIMTPYKQKVLDTAHLRGI